VLFEGDIIVPTRGNRMDIGAGTSHKAKMVELYLKWYEFTKKEKGRLIVLYGRRIGKTRLLLEFISVLLAKIFLPA
jgi:hypothetical protein